MLRGLTTISYWADDVVAATTWYAELLGIEPYFERPGAPAPPAYVEFRVGDHQHELGIIDRRYAPAGTDVTGGVVAYWHVDDVTAAFERLQALGATVHAPVTEHGQGFVTASVVDPFGNVLGVMENAHYVAMLEARA